MSFTSPDRARSPAPMFPGPATPHSSCPPGAAVLSTGWWHRPDQSARTSGIPSSSGTSTTMQPPCSEASPSRAPETRPTCRADRCRPKTRMAPDRVGRGPSSWRWRRDLNPARMPGYSLRIPLSCIYMPLAIFSDHSFSRPSVGKMWARTRHVARRLPGLSHPQAVRTVVIDGEPWFVLADLCKVLGLAAVGRVAARLDEGVRQTHTLQTAGGPQHAKRDRWKFSRGRPAVFSVMTPKRVETVSPWASAEAIARSIAGRNSRHSG